MCLGAACGGDAPALQRRSQMLLGVEAIDWIAWASSSAGGSGAPGVDEHDRRGPGPHRHAVYRHTSWLGRRPSRA